MDKASFALDGSRPNSTSNVFGIIQIQASEQCFIRPIWTQVQLVGREEIASTSRIIVNDTYQISNNPDDWRPLLSSTTNSSDENVYNLPFSLSVPNSLPASFQIQNEGPSLVCCGIYYTLEVKVSTMETGVLKAIQFHTSNNNIMEGEEECDIPKRVFWGITKQSKQRWQYELEFPSTFDLGQCQTPSSISVRLRSVSGQEMKGECCLIGCQIIQSIHLEGYKSHIQVLATSTKLLTNPNKTWKQACQLDFELDRSILPSVANPRLGVEHSIRITVDFCNTNSDCCSNNMDLQFPVVFTGGAFSSQEREQEITVDASVTRALSISSCSSFGELSNHDSAIDIPSSFKSISNYLHSYKLQV
ncbi:hypothetical protein INT47_003268 [Mucor saturninus]|uniref:Uncharacterized protein n=1 Tax=Mucor saturninus TaxID=64648 RepID=A0A8H7RIJ1_9FUNG|nr:hypothetical protein INT47_003268 [Mucor saturninus]